MADPVPPPLDPIAVLHPGAMGAEVGAVLVAAGHEVRWVAAGRSAATAARAERSALTRFADLAGAVTDAGLVVSVCPPARAVDVATAVAAVGFDGTYLDANAVAPETSRAVGDIVSRAGATFVDGGIVGPPPTSAGITRLGLSGAAAGRTAELFAGTFLEPVVLGDRVGTASAWKCAYAGWTKGSAALLLTVAAFARAEGVDDALLAEWDRSQPGLAARAETAAAGSASKAWRWDGEMDEIAAALADHGLPDGFHRAAADLYRALAGFRDVDPPPTLGAVLEALEAHSRSSEADRKP